MKNQPGNAPEGRDSTQRILEPNALSTIDIGSQLDRVLMAYSHGGNPVEELQRLDMVFVEIDEPDAFVEQTARRLFQQSSAFDNLNLQSSLLSNGSPFFGKVLRRMGELVDKEPELAELAKLPVLIRLVEHFRRNQNDERMEIFITRVEQELDGRLAADDLLAHAQLGKVRYEQAMRQFDLKNLTGAIAFAEESMNRCTHGHDLYGILSARGIRGRFQYVLAQSLGVDNADYAELLKKAQTVLLADLRAAQTQISKADKGTTEHRNFTQVEANNAMHLMRITEITEDLPLARAMMKILNENPIQQSSLAIAKRGGVTKADLYAGILETLERKEAEKQARGN